MSDHIFVGNMLIDSDEVVGAIVGWFEYDGLLFFPFLFLAVVWLAFFVFFYAR